MKVYEYFEENTKGEDFVVGDIHGHFSDFMSQLERMGFDESKDRVFSLGDLIDRGPESHRALEFLEKDWFYSIRGNHDQMLIDVHNGDLDHMWMMNGGSWIHDHLSKEDFNDWADRFNQMSYAFSVDCKGKKFGMIHAEIPGTKFFEFVSGLEEQISAVDNAQPIYNTPLVEWALWSRHHITSAKNKSSFATPLERKAFGEEITVEDVDYLLSGHTPLPTLGGLLCPNPQEPFYLGNRVYMDAGKFFVHDKGGELIIKTLSSFSKGETT